jgi:hypothetical protein
VCIYIYIARTGEHAHMPAYVRLYHYTWGCVIDMTLIYVFIYTYIYVVMLYTHTHAGSFNDMYRFSPAANTWTALSPIGSGPSPRAYIGFAATPDGMLYVFGGRFNDGNVGEGGGGLYAT